MKLNEIELTVLVNDRPITEYPHLGRIYVEGRGGSEYQIEIKNHSYQRVEAVISVDGLSVLDGKPAGRSSVGYVIKAYDTLRVPGWTLDNTQVAKFAFAGKEGSYATQMTGDTRNNGVIGVMAFREKMQWNTYPTYVAPATIPQWQPTSVNTPQWQTMNISTSGASGIGTSGMNMGNVEWTATASTAAQSLGTSFGEAATFLTHNVSFQRADGAPTLLTLYYDERRGLRARGIKIGKPFKPQQQALPQAFPATGCTPPPGWQG